MKIVCAHVITVGEAGKLPWGVPAFASEADAAGFVEFVKEELEGGVADFLMQMRQAATGRGKSWKKPVGGTIKVRRKALSVELEFAMERLLKVGHLSCDRIRTPHATLAPERSLQHQQRLSQALQVDLAAGAKRTLGLRLSHDLDLSR